MPANSKLYKISLTTDTFANPVLTPTLFLPHLFEDYQVYQGLLLIMSKHSDWSIFTFVKIVKCCLLDTTCLFYTQIHRELFLSCVVLDFVSRFFYWNENTIVKASLSRKNKWGRQRATSAYVMNMVKVHNILSWQYLGKYHHSSLSFICVAVIKYLDESNLIENGFILALNSRLWSVTMWK